jgi:F-type H+-transporting ATPase subunit b
MVAPLAILAEEAAGTPLFDWWTFGFQVVNFLILVVLLRVFLYGRVIKAMDERDRKIAAHFQGAEEKERQADARASDLVRERAAFESQRTGLLDDARRQAAERRLALEDDARRDVDALAARWRENLAREKEAFLAAVRRRMTVLVCDASRRALADLADEALERRIVAVLLKRLGDMTQEDLAALRDGASRDGGRAVVATASDLPDDDRRRAAETLAKVLGDGVRVDFETAPELVCGVEVRAGGREASWTISHYMDDLERDLAAAVDETAGSDKPESEPEEKADK